MTGDLMQKLDEVLMRLAVIERSVKVQRTKAAYTVKEVAERLDLCRWTVRDCCRHGRIRARKNGSGDWVVSADEMVRLEQQGGPDPEVMAQH